MANGNDLQTDQQRGQWGSRLGFILAAAGSAIGLGNVWKFPYITGENGGGLFVLIYLVCIALVGIPIMVAEIMIGRAAQRQPVAAFHRLQGGPTAWAGIGWLGVAAGFVILSYYIVVAGWAMDYTLKSVVNFTQPIHDAAEIEGKKYVANTEYDAMRTTLAARAATREFKEQERALRTEEPPSVWRAYDRYQQALASVVGADGAPMIEDRYLLDVYREVWQDQPEGVRALSGLGARIPADGWVMNDGSAEATRYRETRTKILHDEEFRTKVEAAEAQLRRIELEREAVLVEAIEHYRDMDDASVMNEAEDLHRRNFIFTNVQDRFVSVLTDGWSSLFWSAIFMLLTIMIVAGGISGGIERACKIMMPLLLVLIVVMVVYGAFQPGFKEALNFVFKPDPSKLRASGVLEALGHAFFTLSLGMGAMITYGSYQRTKESLAGQSMAIAGMDTTIALLACMMIFPITFSYGQEPSAGPGLVFMSMPLAFAEIGGGGMFLAIIFFGLLVFAALTSSISLLEVVASYFIDERGWSRKRASWTLGAVVLGVGALCAFAADPRFVMTGWEPSYGKNFFDTMDYLASNWMLPLGGLFIAIYAGWVMPRRLREAELDGLNPLLAGGWLMLVRFVAPALVIVVLMQKIGILDADELFHGLFAG